MAFHVHFQQRAVRADDPAGEQLVQRRRPTLELHVGFVRLRDVDARAAVAGAAGERQPLLSRLGQRDRMHRQRGIRPCETFERRLASRLGLDEVYRRFGKHLECHPRPVAHVRASIDDDTRPKAAQPQQLESVAHRVEAVRRPPPLDAIAGSAAQALEELFAHAAALTTRFRTAANWAATARAEYSSIASRSTDALSYSGSETDATNPS